MRCQSIVLARPSLKSIWLRRTHRRFAAASLNQGGQFALFQICWQSLAAHETVARTGSDIVQIAQVSRVSEQIEVHDFDALLRLQDVAHEAGTDESGAAG